MNTTLPRLLVGLLILTFVSPALAKEEAGERPSPLICWTLPSLMNRFLENHVSVREQSKELEARIIELYAEGYDGTKTLLLDDEFAQLTATVEGLVKNVRKGRCEAFGELQKKRIAWHQDMEDFARKLLSDPALKIDETLELQLDADKRPRPKTQAEQDALRTRLLHFQLANYMRGEEKLDEAKKRLIHRYELITKRVSEQTEADAFTEFLNAFANALDPHSTYFSADMLEDFRISMDLSLEGIGAVLQSRDGYTTIQEVVPGGAADRHGGLKAKDKVIAVTQVPDGEPVDVIDMALRDVVRMIRGKKGTKVKLTVLRKGERTESHDFVIVRDKIDLKEQAAKLEWHEVERNGRKMKLARIDLPSFYGGGRGKGRDAVRDMRRLLGEVRKGGADGVLLDLSRNGGGLLQGAVDIAGLFLREGPMVGIDGPSTPSQILEDEDDDIQWNGPLVVLTSKGSASASEIVAGALKDYRRAVLVGDSQTFGKGSVQNIINLPAGFGALKVTTAMFFRPGGKSTQSRGVEADIVLPSVFDTDEIGEASQKFALPTRTIPKFGKDTVQGEDDRSRWAVVTDGHIAALGAASKARVSTSKDFDEVREAITKRKSNTGPMKIAELLEDDEDEAEKEKEEAKKTPSDEPRIEGVAKDDEDDEPTPHTLEALQILADLASGAADSRAAVEGR